MIAQIPSGAFQIPDYALWMIAGWVLTSLITGWGGYRWGLRSQKEAARLKARNEVYAIIDRIRADMETNRSFWGLESKAKTELKKFTIQFSSQFAKADRLRIQKALDSYQALYISAWEWPPKGTPERLKFDQEYKAMIDGLTHLRDEISAT